jgi:lysophospholipase L1-like esterase
MKPLRIFIFFGAVTLLLFLLALIIPRQGISITPGIRLKFMDLSDLAVKDTVDRDQMVEQLMAASTVTEDPEAVETFYVPAVRPANVDSLKKTVHRIQFAESGSGLLNPFFIKLEGLTDGSVVRTRILHFGDSQIENDRMTALIRFRMQKQFGGTGTGLIQAIPLYSGHMAYQQEQEGEWLRYTFFGSRDSTISHNAYGIMGAFSSVPMTGEGNWPSLHYRFNTSRRTGTLDRVRVFLHSYVENASLAFVVNDTLTDTIRNVPDGFSVADYRQHDHIKDLNLSMDLPEGGRIYGISFESYRGLQMDNIAMRGGSGLIFTKMNREQQLRMMEYLGPGLLILQYGGNVVPYINASYYHRSFKRELAFLKDVCPGVPIIVIGPSDMSLKEKGRFVTYPGIEPVRDALQQAAMESGVAFWDLYEAMGGYNSMPSFVHADPPLASTDYVHFTALGVNLVAEMFYNALMLEYNHYSSKSR